MVEQGRVRDLLPRAPARLSKQVDIGDIILTVDGVLAEHSQVLALLRGSDQGFIPTPHSPGYLLSINL